MTAPSLSPGLDPRDGVLAVLSAQLRGPRRVRAELLTELRDGLDDATADLEAAGLPPAEARHRAVVEFGDPVGLARELQAELTGTQARRTALTVAVISPLIETLWDWGYPALMRDLWRHGGRPTELPLLGWLSEFQQTAVWIVAPLLLLTYGLIRRRQVALRAMSWLIGLLAVGLLGVNLVAAGLMAALNPGLIAALRDNPPGLLLQFGSLAVMLVLIRSTVRTVRLLAIAPPPVPRQE